MAKKKATTFAIVVKSKNKKNNSYRVYIRVTHGRDSRFIFTGKQVHENKVRIIKTEKKEEKQITDSTILKVAYQMIDDFTDKLNRQDPTSWNVEKVVEFLEAGGEEIPFVPFCREYISGLYGEKASNTADGYMDALKSFVKHCGEDVTFQKITTEMLDCWIKALAKTKRAKQKYPQLIQTMFDAGRKKFNDYNNRIYRIENMPFETLVIPKSDPTEPEPISVEDLRKIFGFVPDDKFAHAKRSQKAQEIMKLSFYFVGMNTVDLFNMRKDNYKEGKLCYNRTKTKNTGQHKGYTEVSVLPEIQAVFNKYRNDGDGENLFDFGYGNPKDLYKNVNKGLRAICDQIGIEKVTTYNFRYSWATIADNEFEIDESKIAFCLTHAPSERLTRKYIRKTYTPIDEVNKMVTNLIFYPERLEKPEEENTLEVGSNDRLAVAV